ncbi:hypothetical protein [Zobellia sp. OII3]|uniref:hypothetical protein n=1 Tax=Zobellia sp. OII3 TaxID=2034520 RepID=UPI000F500F55|nr:hypothetical protein [Zobellia sp. OII3]
MNRFALIVFCFLFFGCTSKHDAPLTQEGKDADSALFHYKRAKEKTLSVKERYQAINQSYQHLKNDVEDSLYGPVLFQKSLLHLLSKEYDSLRIYHDQLANHAPKVKKASVLAEQYYLMGYYFSEVEHDYHKSIENYSLSKEYYTQLKDSSRIGINLLNIGTIQKNNNDFFGSKETLTDALKFLKNPKKVAHCYNALATNHRKLLNFSDAIDYYQKAIHIEESAHDRLIYENNLAATYIDSKSFDKAMELLNKIVKDSTLGRNQKQYARVLDNLAYARWLSGLPVKKEAFEEPLSIRIQQKDKRGQIASYTHLGEFHSKSNPVKARSYLDSVIQLSKSLKIPRAEKDALKQLMQLAPNAIGIRDRYVFLQDSLYDQELKVKTQFAKYRYDDKLKQESILHLEKESAEHLLEAAKQRNQKIISYSGLALIVLISVFTGFFSVQRAKRLKQENKTAKIEATYATEAELSRKLHDDFAGKLNHAMVLLQNGAPNTEVLNVIDGLYNQSRDFSRKINDIDTGPKFKEVLFGMLSSYCRNTQLIVTGSTEIDWGKLPELSKKTLYKVLQELMINMQKHSGATVVSIHFEALKTKLKVNYTDNGKGASKNNLNHKNGLWNTEKRILAINGSLTFDSEKGDGFRAQIEIPN